MMLLYKPQIDFISEHAVDPDMRRYAIAEEGPQIGRASCRERV